MPRISGPSIFTDDVAAASPFIGSGSASASASGVPTSGGPVSGAYGGETFPLTGGDASVNVFGKGLTLGDITNKNGSLFLTEVNHLVEIVSKFEAITIKSILGSLILGQPFETTQWNTLRNSLSVNGINLGFFKDTNLICSFRSDGSILISTDDGNLQEMRLGSTKPKPRECTTGISVPVICSTAQDLTLNLERMAAKATTPVVTPNGTDSKFHTGNKYHSFYLRPKLNMDSTLTPMDSTLTPMDSTLAPGSSQNVVYATADLGDVTLMPWSLSAVNPTATLQELITNYPSINNGIKIQSFETLKQDIDSLLTEIFKLIKDAAIDILQFPIGFVEGYRYGLDFVNSEASSYAQSGYYIYSYKSLQDINILVNNYNKSDLYNLAYDLGFYFSYNILYNFYMINGGEIISGNIQTGVYFDPVEFSKLIFNLIRNGSYKEGTFKDGLKKGLNKGFIVAEISASNNIQLQDVPNPNSNEVIYNDGYILGYWIGWNFIMKIKGLMLNK